MQYFKHKRVLVTGGAGFIGSHLCETLLEYGATVVAVDNFVTGSKKNIEHLLSNDRFSFIEADVITLPETFLSSEQPFDCVLHFASPASPPRYQAHPVETYLVNSQATHNLLQYLKTTNPQARFLFASTSEVYGDPQEHPQKESYWGNVNPNGIRSCYDEAKRMGETICGVHQRDLQMDVRIVRIFNTYGPRMDINDGRSIPNFIKEALAGKPLSIYGDGLQTRSYCYVSDLVQGILLVLSGNNLQGITVNLGNPGEYTIQDAATIIWNEIQPNKQLEIEHHDLPADDPLKRRPDISKAESLLSWSPTIAFEDGIKKTIEYFKQ